MPGRSHPFRHWQIFRGSLLYMRCCWSGMGQDFYACGWVCVCSWRYRLVCIWILMYRGQRLTIVFSSLMLHLSFWDRASEWTWSSVIQLARLTNELQRNHLPLPASTSFASIDLPLDWDFYRRTRDRIQFPALSQQVFFLIEPHPQVFFGGASKEYWNVE